METIYFKVRTLNDQGWIGVWQQAGESRQGLRDWCTVQAAKDTKLLNRIKADASALDRFLTAAARGPELTLDQETLVVDCFGLIDFLKGQGDSRANQAWSLAGSTYSGLRSLCEDLVLQNPDLAVALQAELRAIKRFLANARPTPAPTLPPLQWMPALPESNDGGWGGGGDLDCEDIGQETWVGDYDPHGLDGDNDGWGCEGW